MTTTGFPSHRCRRRGRSGGLSGRHQHGREREHKPMRRPSRLPLRWKRLPRCRRQSLSLVSLTQFIHGSGFNPYPQQKAPASYCTSYATVTYLSCTGCYDRAGSHGISCRASCKGTRSSTRSSSSCFQDPNIGTHNANPEAKAKASVGMAASEGSGRLSHSNLQYLRVSVSRWWWR